MSISEGNVEQIRRKLVNSSRKSIRRTSFETQIPKSSVWRIVRKRLQMKPHKLQFVQALKADNTRKRIQFCIDMKQELEEDQFDEKLVFSDEATFHTSKKVIKQNVRIWGLENPHESLEQVRDSPKVNVFCAISKKHVHGPYFFDENVTGDNYLHMLQAWLMDRLTANEAEDFIFQQDGASIHWKLSVRAYLNVNLPGRWIGRAGNDDSVLLKWPTRSPDFTPCDFFLWGYVKDLVYVPPLPQTSWN